MAQSGPQDDFYVYTQEWTKAISRGGILEVSNVAFFFFRRLDMLMREFLCQHLVSHTISKDGVTKAVAEDEDLLLDLGPFIWAAVT